MSAVRLVASDLDGTLLHADGSLSARTLAALEATSAAGIVVVFATGRHWGATEPFLAHTQAVQYCLCVNGSEVRDRSGTVLRATEIDPEATAAVVRGLREVLSGVRFGVDVDGVHVGEHGLGEALPSGVEIGAGVADVLEAIGPGVRDLVVYHRDHRNDLAGLHRAVSAVVHDLGLAGLEVGYSGLPMIELVAEGSTKGSALAWLCAELGVDVTEVVAFGDQRNDLTMLRWAGTGVAMGNALPEVRMAADQVAGHHDDDAVAAYLEDLLGATDRSR